MNIEHHARAGRRFILQRLRALHPRHMWAGLVSGGLTVHIPKRVEQRRNIALICPESEGFEVGLNRLGAIAARGADGWVDPGVLNQLQMVR
jgi:hypothetical protein